MFYVLSVAYYISLELEDMSHLHGIQDGCFVYLFCMFCSVCLSDSFSIDDAKEGGGTKNTIFSHCASE